jgi:hypothetical protein
MPATAAEVLQEFEFECATTRRVPRGDWPGLISQWALHDLLEMPDIADPPQPTSSAEILAAHDESVRRVKRSSGH